ncbi:hypothetical protein BJ166DRAFT_508847 [Pestalotiopsis sp. NC0098]|nr:hypothetical protein BJ166DRAFT_508847 [Pestalotiopsis sp. NC0098]
MSSSIPDTDRAHNIDQPGRVFKIALWICIGICILLLSLRLLIRLVSFRRLFIEDYLMLLSVALLTAAGTVLQIFLEDINFLVQVETQSLSRDSEIGGRMTSGLRASGIIMILGSLGIWSIKINFLAFFRGFGSQIRTYMILWWIALFLVVAAGVVEMGMIPYPYLFVSTNQIMEKFPASSTDISHYYSLYRGAVAIDVISDAIIICFPLYIIWRTTLNLRQKLLLTSVFFLVGLTISVTIIRGSIFGGMYESSKSAHVVVDQTLLLAWVMAEYVVSFIIACIISFRSLWVSRTYRAKNQKLEKENRKCVGRNKECDPQERKRSKWQRIEDSLLKSCVELEGRDIVWNGSELIKLEVPSSSLAVDFSQWGETGVTTSTDVSGDDFNSRSVSV